MFLILMTHGGRTNYSPGSQEGGEADQRRHGDNKLTYAREMHCIRTSVNPARSFICNTVLYFKKKQSSKGKKRETYIVLRRCTFALKAAFHYLCLNRLRFSNGPECEEPNEAQYQCSMVMMMTSELS